MKNLKLFVAPLLGATLLLTACGPKPVSAEDFKKKVTENYKIATIREKYVGKTIHMTGTDIDDSAKITAVNEDEGHASFTFDKELFFTLVPYDILTPTVVEDIGELGIKGKINFYIGSTYTVDMSGEQDGAKGSMKFVFNSDLVISHAEMKGTQSGESIDLKLDYKYE